MPGTIRSAACIQPYPSYLFQMSSPLGPSALGQLGAEPNPLKAPDIPQDLDIPVIMRIEWGYTGDIMGNVSPELMNP